MWKQKKNKSLNGLADPRNMRGRDGGVAARLPASRPPGFEPAPPATMLPQFVPLKGKA